MAALARQGSGRPLTARKATHVYSLYILSRTLKHGSTTQLCQINGHPTRLLIVNGCIKSCSHGWTESSYLLFLGWLASDGGCRVGCRGGLVT